LAGYEFIQTVGKGAMGSVYLAKQVALNRLVAIKQVLGAWNGDPQALERFRREARALAKMNHPNIVGIYNLEAVGTDLYMIQEYIHGPTLKQILGNARLSTGQAMRVVGEVSAALGYASKQGILHRDLKPGNLFITTTGVCKLGDFGLVKMMGGQGNFVTQVGTILGTPSYMSPEQAGGKADIDQRTDVYSLGVMAYELLVGRLPFPPIPGNVMATVEAHISTPPPRPSQVAPGFPNKVEDVLLNALAKDPKKRYKTAGDFWVKLADAAEKSWPGWAGESDLSAVATAAAPIPPVSTIAGAPSNVAPPPPLPGAPPAARTISPLDTTALMAGSEDTLVRPSDETIVQSGAAADQTVALGGAGAAAAEETVVQGPQSMHRDHPTGAPEFVPPPTAPMPAPAAVPTAAAFAVPQVQAPVYKPPKVKQKGGGFKRFLRNLVFLLVLLLVIAGGAYYLLNRGVAPAVAVTAVEAAANPPVGHCPSATFVFTGRIHTNGGAGNITYQWIQPDGTPATPTDQQVEKGSGIITVTLQFTYHGQGSADGNQAQLKVLKPSAIDSNPAPVQYRCP
ncbi:MAG: serine/threonine protein kinase, partial [Candidatus Dormibacteria bacterium]